jgi:hypothetical protein
MVKAPTLGVHTISPKEREFFYTVGVALTDWAQIDEQLFRLCGVVLKSADRHVAIVYYRTPTLRARVELVDELVRSTFPKPTRKSGDHASGNEKKWKDLKTDIIDALEIRNQLAHSPASPMAEFSKPPYDTRSPVMTDTWWASYESGTQRMRGKSPAKRDLKVDDVKTHLATVSNLYMRLCNLREEFSKLLLTSDRALQLQPDSERSCPKR